MALFRWLVIFLVGAIAWAPTALAQPSDCIGGAEAQAIIRDTHPLPQFVAQGYMAYGQENITLNQIVRISLNAQNKIDRSATVNPKTSADIKAASEAIGVLLCQLTPPVKPE